jgi:phage FluMu gp28-like protein
MILPFLKLDLAPTLARHFLPYQVNWIEAEDAIHAQKLQAFALAEKSIRIGWTYCDGFKNVRKRLRFKKRDYLFVTKDYPSALEYMNQAWDFAELFDLTSSILSHGEEFLKIPRLDDRGRPGTFTEEVKVGVIKFDNGSRIIAFSSNPQAMAVYGGDVGLDEFAKHPNAQLLWETAQGRVMWGFDLAVWSAHDGEDTLFYQFAQEARAASNAFDGRTSSASPQLLPGPTPPSTLDLRPSTPQAPASTSTPSCLWNLYYHVTIEDAIASGLLDRINAVRGTKLTPDRFLADCRSRAGLEEIFQQSYLCNPVPRAASIVDWSAIERCRFDYQIERLHLEHDQIQKQFGSPATHLQPQRETAIRDFLHSHFPFLFTGRTSSASPQFPSDPGRAVAFGEGGSTPPAPASTHSLPYLASLPFPVQNSPRSILNYRLGFDVAASGRGDLAAFYLDAIIDSQAWLTALLTCRTDDWHFLKTVLFTFLRDLPRIQGCGDESGLGRQICWEAANHFGQNKFTPINFATRKSDLGLLLMNLLSSGQKRFPKAHPDIAADFFALRKSFNGTKWVFAEGRNNYNTASHCDIAWAGALASEANVRKRSNAWAMVG